MVDWIALIIYNGALFYHILFIFFEVLFTILLVAAFCRLLALNPVALVVKTDILVSVSLENILSLRSKVSLRCRAQSLCIVSIFHYTRNFIRHVVSLDDTSPIIEREKVCAIPHHAAIIKLVF